MSGQYVDQETSYAIASEPGDVLVLDSAGFANVDELRRNLCAHSADRRGRLLR